ncbi:MAG: HTH domain-containing protein [Spirochaetales bacterium]|nr:HTH domain-containing protein [Spirochaetales bacterium]
MRFTETEKTELKQRFTDNLTLDLVEQTGYGIPLVTNRYGKTVFEFLDFFLRVTIPFEFELESEDIQDVSQGSQKGSQKSSQKIIEMINRNAQITTQEMADALGISRRAVAKAIAKLQETNCVRRVGSDKGGHWEIITEK